MLIQEEYIRLIFGLKLKQIRTEKNLSLYGLSKLSGLSKSYLNEIEKGKKYPKTDKIVLLSEVLEVPYDNLVSLKLNKNLAPIGRIFRTKILKEIPLEHFGIQESTLIDIIANAPAKVNTFITTIIEIAQHYNFTRESFYLASVRTHQEANNNYFDTIEQEVIKFTKVHQINLDKLIETDELKEILVEEFGYTINETELEKHKEIKDLRSVFVPKSKTLLLAKQLDDEQKAFIFAKELAYNHLKYKERLYTFSWIKFDNFDQVLNNFYASYFAGGLLIPKKTLTENLKGIFEKPKFNAKKFIQLIHHFNASPETFYYRLTNILPKDFNLQNLFFIRLAHKKGSKQYHIEKELHLINNPNHSGNDTKELYSRRWVAVNALDKMEQKTKDAEFDLQIYHQAENDNKYLVFSYTEKENQRKEKYKSICLGLLINKQLERKISFLESLSTKNVTINDTNEDLQLFDSQNRISKPIELKLENNDNLIQNTVDKIYEKYS